MTVHTLKPMPIVTLRSESEASYLINKTDEIGKGKRLIGEVEIKSHEQPHVSLGNYTPSDQPKGFSVHINPALESDAITTQMTRLGTNKEYELVLHIANYGNRTVCAEVWSY